LIYKQGMCSLEKIDSGMSMCCFS